MVTALSTEVEEQPLTRQPGTRMKGEPRNAYKAFTIFRDLEGRRTVVAAIRASPKGSPVNAYGHYAFVWSWAARVDEWDAYLAEKERIARIKALDEMEKRHITMARKLQEKALGRLEKLQMNKLTHNDVVRFMDLGMKIERDIVSRHREDDDIEQLQPRKQTFTIRMGEPLSREEALPAIAGTTAAEEFVEGEITHGSPDPAEEG